MNPGKIFISIFRILSSWIIITLETLPDEILLYLCMDTILITVIYYVKIYLNLFNNCAQRVKCLVARNEFFHHTTMCKGHWREIKLASSRTDDNSCKYNPWELSRTHFEEKIIFRNLLFEVMPGVHINEGNLLL